jgi:hypothetical protein
MRRGRGAGRAPGRDPRQAAPRTRGAERSGAELSGGPTRAPGLGVRSGEARAASRVKDPRRRRRALVERGEDRPARAKTGRPAPSGPSGAHAARRGGQPGEAKKRPGTKARDAERRGAGRAPVERSRAERSGGPTRAHGIGVRSGEARAARRGRIPPAAAPRARGARAGRPAGRPEKAIREHEELALQESVQRATQKQLGGAGVFARYKANRAEIKGARSSNAASDDACCNQSNAES